MTDQNQNPGASQQATHDGGKDGVNALDLDPPWQNFDVERKQAHRCESFDSEHAPHGLVAKHVKGQIDHKQDRAYGPSGGVVDQKSQAGGASCQQRRSFEKQHRQCHKQRPGEQALYILQK